MKKILSVLGLMAAFIVCYAPFIAGGDFGISAPWLADPNGTTVLPSGIELHVSYTMLGMWCAILGAMATAFMSVLVVRAFSK